MLLPIPAQFRRRRGRPKAASTAPAPPPLTLLEGIYIPDDGSLQATLTLAFNRAIDASGYLNEAIMVRDGVSRLRLLIPNGGLEMLEPQRVLFILDELDGTPAGDVILDATSLSGIVAADDGSPWAGADNLVLPFP